MAFRLTVLLALTTPVISQTVSIFQQIPATVNQCIRPCLFRPNSPNADIGDTLECRAPYRDDCYCATDNAKSASKHIDSCAKASCSRGDVTQDAEAMKSYYASYCMGNGYTADAMKEWYTNTDTAATKTIGDFWGWASSTGTRRGLWGDEDTTATATATAAATSDSRALFLSRAQLVLIGFSLLMILF
ncbi:hypothetical protein BKA59DRAFT_535147 [Fusarium tricinctum]|uniref:Extracellular membrane protein CFEM domain-containing protein n=1 Tax=Fusarium tricinctum TaxID=61284 RepID=A0A8K0RPN4_9HYPO|nr:hypothetical protein BKA59DRAFT_535147 [Fusarium tricinctum]